MAGSNVAAELGMNQIHPDFEGIFLQFGNGVPTDGTSSPQAGAGRGGLYVNTGGTDGATVLYINAGTLSSPTWTNVAGES